MSAEHNKFKPTIKFLEEFQTNISLISFDILLIRSDNKLDFKILPKIHLQKRNHQFDFPTQL